MKYMIASHGCYFNTERILLHGIKLLFFSEQDECIDYHTEYVNDFCRDDKSHNAYIPKFVTDQAYYQMLFCRSDHDNVPCFIKCCDGEEKILYDFFDGDLLLSDVLDIIRIHESMKGNGQIELSVLTCNMECSDTSTKYTKMSLHRSFSYIPQNVPNHVIQQRNISRKKRMNHMETLELSDRKRHHIPKIGDTMVNVDTGEKTIIKTKQQANQMINPQEVYVPRTKKVSYVIYKSELWKILGITKSHIKFCEIENSRTGEVDVVDSRDLIQTSYTDKDLEKGSENINRFDELVPEKSKKKKKKKSANKSANKTTKNNLHH